MACGTGKSLLAIRTIDSLVDSGEIALFLAPSLALIDQMIKEFFKESLSPSYQVFAVCSDGKVGSTKSEDLHENELCISPTTSPKSLAHAINTILTNASFLRGGGGSNAHSLESSPKIVIFSTYQSIDVIIDSQKLFNKPLKIIINDEAHRTAGVQKLDEFGKVKDISVWQKTHNNDLLDSTYRLYLTATPRIYSDKAKDNLKEKSQGNDLALFSMDDEATFGKEIYSLRFHQAIKQNLLSDYRVVISYMRQEYLAEYLGKLTKAQEKLNLTLEDAGKMVAFSHALKKRSLNFVDENGAFENYVDDTPMRRAVAFHRSIRNSKVMTSFFSGEKSPIDKDTIFTHIDGTDNAYAKSKKLGWLAQDLGEQEARVLSNAKCLTEGIDVPSLDAVCFFDKRDSVVDIVQAVGRAIRKSEGKKYGYIILPLVLSDEEIKNYDKTLREDKFKIVWQTLKALRSHDERLIDEARIAEVVSISAEWEPSEIPESLLFSLSELFTEMKNAVPKNLGDLQYWENYASKVGDIMQALILRIQALLDSSSAIQELFATFCKALQSNLNASFNESEAIALVAQHIITKPIFECIFPSLDFTTFDKVSAELEKLHTKLLEQGLNAETRTLEKFYTSVRENAQYAKSDKSKQSLIKNLYDTLFKQAFKKTQEKLGIVYTPIEGVDFIVHSTQYLLQKHFGKSLGDEHIHIADPFTGTGTFITRTIQSGYLDSRLESKFAKELWANEITLLGYYIAQINIATTYHERLLYLRDSALGEQCGSVVDFVKGTNANSGDEAIADLSRKTSEAVQGEAAAGFFSKAESSSDKPTPEIKLFDNLLFTDTFNTYAPDSKGFKGKQEDPKLFDSEYLEKNYAKIQEFKQTSFKVIISNPPYSANQSSSNDNNANESYPFMEQRMQDTYLAHSTSTYKGKMYDTLKMALRYASDRIETNGIIGFVMSASFLDGNADSGLRACLADEFDYIYIFNLRGNQRTSGETSRKEGGKFFDSGSRTPVAICFFVKLDSSMDCHALPSDKARNDDKKVDSSGKTRNDNKTDTISPSLRGGGEATNEAIHKTTAQKVDSSAKMDCHATATALARNDDKTSPLSHCETSAGSLGNPKNTDSSDNAQNAAKQLGGRIFDEKVGLCSGEQGDKTGASIDAVSHKLPAFSQKANAKSTQKPTPSKAKIYYYDIGDYLDRQTKLNIIQNFKSIESMEAQGLFTLITPNIDHDWINQRDYSFMAFMPIANKKLKEVPLNAIPSLKNRDKIDAEVFAENYVDMFEMYSQGILTSRDAWCFNFSAKELESNMTRMIDNYNAEVEKHKADSTYKPTMDSTKINWSANLMSDFQKDKTFTPDNSRIISVNYRPFTKCHLYLDKAFNERLVQMPQIYPAPQAQNIEILDCEAGYKSYAKDFFNAQKYLPNLTICVSGIGGREPSSLIANNITEIAFVMNSQCFPLYYYERLESSAENGQMTMDYALAESMDCHADKSARNDKNLSEQAKDSRICDEKSGLSSDWQGSYLSGNDRRQSRRIADLSRKAESTSKATAYYKRKDAIRDEALAFFQNAYNDSTINKEAMFYYIYALLNHPTYIATYKDNLSKMLPRIPLMQDFWGFVASGRALAQLHINYESHNTPDSRAFACLAKDLHEFKTSAKGLFEKDFRQKAREDIAHLSEEDFRIEAIKLHTKGVKDSILLNDKIAIVNIPAAAHRYQVNGKSAIEWILDRYKISTDKASGIVNDPNLYESTSGALAELKGGRYVCALLLSVIEMSARTSEILESIPEYKLLES